MVPFLGISTKYWQTNINANADVVGADVDDNGDKILIMIVGQIQVIIHHRLRGRIRRRRRMEK